MNYPLETNRLLLSEFTPDDAPFIIELVNTPGWLKYIGDRNVKTPDQANAYLENGTMKSYRENGFGLWKVTMKETQTPIGMCGLLRRGYLDHHDIGFAFLPSFTGKGFAYEAAEATISFAKRKLNLSTICAITLPNNQSSIKLLEKLGMKLQKTMLPPNSNQEVLLYRNDFLDFE